MILKIVRVGLNVPVVKQRYLRVRDVPGAKMDVHVETLVHVGVGAVGLPEEGLMD